MNHTYNTSFNQWQKNGKPSGYNFHKSLLFSVKVKKILQTNNLKLLAFCILFLVAIIVSESGSGSYIKIFFLKTIRFRSNIYTFSFYSVIISIKNFFSDFFYLKRILEVFFGALIWRCSNKSIDLLEIKLANVFKKFKKN